MGPQAPSLKPCKEWGDPSSPLPINPKCPKGMGGPPNPSLVPHRVTGGPQTHSQESWGVSGTCGAGWDVEGGHSSPKCWCSRAGSKGIETGEGRVGWGWAWGGAGVTHSWSPAPQETPVLLPALLEPSRAPLSPPSSPGKAAKDGPGAGLAKGSPPMSARRSVLAFRAGWGGRWAPGRGWGGTERSGEGHSPWAPPEVARSHLWQCPCVPMEELGGPGLCCGVLGGLFHLFWCHIPAVEGQNID